MPHIGAKIAFMPRNRNIRIQVRYNWFRIDRMTGTRMKKTGTNGATFAGNQPRGWGRIVPWSFQPVVDGQWQMEQIATNLEP